MSIKDELVAVIIAGYGEIPAEVEPCEQDLEIADAILDAGYRKPRAITTAEDLDALWDGSAVLDATGDVSTKHADRWHGYEMAPLQTAKFAKYGPFTVLHDPGAAS